MLVASQQAEWTSGRPDVGLKCSHPYVLHIHGSEHPLAREMSGSAPYGSRVAHTN